MSAKRYADAMITINLMSRRLREQRRLQRKYWLIMLLGALLIVIPCVWRSVVTAMRAYELQQLLDQAANMELGDSEERKPSLTQWQQIKQAEYRLARVWRLNRQCYVILSQVLHQLPDSVRLDVVAWRAKRMTLKGEVGKQTVGVLLRWLQQQRHTITSLKLTQSNAMLLDFNIDVT